MEEYVEELVSRYRGSGVLVDTNLLLLLFVGGYDPGLIERFRLTMDRFVAADFDTLSTVLSAFDRIVTTPHILTETSNLLGQLTGRARIGCFGHLARSIPSMRETYVPSADLVEQQAFVEIGITDTSILRS